MIFNKLKNSQKLIKLIKITKDFPFYFADIFILIYSFIYNLLFFQKIYDKNFVIVTGSDKYFANTLLQLLDNLNRYNFIKKIYVYDLGLEKKNIDNLSKFSSKVQIINFNFSEHEEFISKRDTHGTLGAYAWKPNIVWAELQNNKSKVIWLDSANLINYRFIFVLIVLTCKGFFSPMSAKKIKDLTYGSTIEALGLPNRYLNKRNLTGGFVGFDWNNSKSRELARMWVKNSNIEELILPKKSSKHNHRWDQSILSVLFYKMNSFGYIPKVKSIFGIKVNQNPNQDFFLYYSGSNEDILNFYNEWYKMNKIISTKTIKYSRIIWLLSWDSYKKIPRKYLKSRKIICQVENLDEFNQIYSTDMMKRVDKFTTNNKFLANEVIEKYGQGFDFYIIDNDVNKLRIEMIKIKNDLT